MFRNVVNRGAGTWHVATPQTLVTNTANTALSRTTTMPATTRAAAAAAAAPSPSSPVVSAFHSYILVIILMDYANDSLLPQ